MWINNLGYAYDGDYSEHKIHQASEKLKDLEQSRIIAMICQNELTNHTLVIVLGRTGFGHGLPPRQAAMCSSRRRAKGRARLALS